jgi:ribonuclease R
MTVNKQGNVVDSEITPSVIRSSKRLTYTAVQKVLDGDKKSIEKYSEQFNSIMLMNELADILIAKREKNGSIDLDVKESVISVRKNGEITVTASSQDKAHRLIEEFMILANVTVAEFAFFTESPFVYRIHEEPSIERLEHFYAFLSGLGVNVKKRKDQVFPKDFQAILKNAENCQVYTLINRVMLRSMQKAKYAPIDKGHFGLSLSHYCHFTSPIRRYPDLVVHRILKDVLSGVDNLNAKYDNFTQNASVQSSEKEKNATEAERAVDDYYKLLYISEFIGSEFDAVISGVTGFGLFAELDNAIEGLIKINTIKGKKFVYNQKHYTLSDGKTTFRLGQRVKIKVVGVNLGERKAEFVLVD